MHSTCDVNEVISSCNTGEVSEGHGFRGGIFNVSKEFPEFNMRFGGHLVECSDRVLDVIAHAANNPRRIGEVRAILIELLHLSISKGHSSGRNRKEHRFQIVVTGMGADRVYTIRAVCGPCDGYGPAITFKLVDE